MNFRAEVAPVGNTDIVITRVLSLWQERVYWLLTLISWSSIVPFGWYWFSTNRGSFSWYFCLISSILVVKLCINQTRWFLLPQMRKAKPVLPPDGWRVGVVTTFVPGAESLQMLERTLRALQALEYPHDTWVLDEGDHPQVRSLCSRLGVKHFSRKNLPHYHSESGTFRSHSKHGNYNAWLREFGYKGYDFISAFDPDHIPSPEFLSQVLGYFQSPKVGYVQAAQAYYNQGASFIARGAAEETYAYNAVTQPASFGAGYTIISGSHNTHRVAALQEAGGFAAHDADDLLLTLHYRQHDWQGVYVPQIVARGLTPVDWKGYLNQQWRWARSILDIKLRQHARFTRNLPLKERVLSFLHGLSYVEGSFSIAGILSLLALSLATGRTIPVFENGQVLLTICYFIALAGVLAGCDLFRQQFYLYSDEQSVHWRALLLQFAKWPYHLLALADALTGRRTRYLLTPKVSDQTHARTALWPHALTPLLLTICWLIGREQGVPQPAFTAILAASAASISVALLLSEFRTFPPAFESSLEPAPTGTCLGETV